MLANPYQQYRATKVETAGSVDLVVMLFQGAVKFIRLGIQAIEQDDAQAVNTNLTRAQDIVVELLGSLNREDGGEIATQLAAVYEYCFRQLVRANVRRDAELAREVLGLLRDLGMTWQQLAVQQRHARGAEFVSPRPRLTAIAV